MGTLKGEEEDIRTRALAAGAAVPGPSGGVEARAVDRSGSPSSGGIPTSRIDAPRAPPPRERIERKRTDVVSSIAAQWTS